MCTVVAAAAPQKRNTKARKAAQTAKAAGAIVAIALALAAASASARR
jgi:hypothetical protein